MSSTKPTRVYLFSGKRKSGKDFFTELLLKRLDPDNVAVIRLSAPIKSHWATKNHLDYDKLLGNSEYKESYRKSMIEWSVNIRNKDYGYFCRAALEMSKAKDKPLWIVTDARRITDIKWFKENFGDAVKTFRIVADDGVRKTRGWKFTEGIDDEETECGLDGFSDWTEIIINDGTQNLEPTISKLVLDLNNSLM